MVAQVGLSSFLVAGTPCLDCQVPSAAAVMRPELAVGGDADDLLGEHHVGAGGALLEQRVAAGRSSSAPGPVRGAGVVVDPVGPVSGLVTATPLHQEVRL